MFLYFFRRNWRFKYKQNSRSSRRPSGRCLSERVDIFLSSGESSGWSKHDVCDRRPATWMSPRAVPVRMRYTLSTALENSHSETDICLRAFCRFGSSSGLPIFILPFRKSELLNYSFLYIIGCFPELMPIICFLIRNLQCLSIY